MLDRQVGDAPPRVQAEGRRERVRRAGVEAAPARAATLLLGRVALQLERGEDRAEEHPVAEAPPEKVGVLALPAQARGLRQRLLHHRGGVHEHLDRVAPRILGRLRLLQQPAAHALEPLLHHVVVVAPARIDAHRRPVGPARGLQRIAFGRVALGQHHDRARLAPERARIGAPCGAVLHPPHLSVHSLAEERAEPLRRLGDRVRPAHPHGDEARIEREGPQPVGQGGRVIRIPPGARTIPGFRPGLHLRSAAALATCAIGGTPAGVRPAPRIRLAVPAATAIADATRAVAVAAGGVPTAVGAPAGGAERFGLCVHSQKSRSA